MNRVSMVGILSNFLGIYPIGKKFPRNEVPSVLAEYFDAFISGFQKFLGQCVPEVGGVMHKEVFVNANGFLVAAIPRQFDW